MGRGHARLLGVEVPDAAQGVLQDVHWGAGLFGYFPTYTLGNLIAAQLWTRIQQDLPEIEAQFGRGELAPLRDWLREHIHRHGRKFPPRELLMRVTGDTLAPSRSSTTCARNSPTPARCRTQTTRTGRVVARFGYQRIRATVALLSLRHGHELAPVQ